MKDKNSRDKLKKQQQHNKREDVKNQPGDPRELNRTDHAGEETAGKSGRSGAGQQQGSGGNPVIN